MSRLNHVRSNNIRNPHVGPVKPSGHRHSAIVAAICLHVPPFEQVVIEQTEAKYDFHIYI